MRLSRSHILNGVIAAFVAASVAVFIGSRSSEQASPAQTPAPTASSQPSGEAVGPDTGETPSPSLASNEWSEQDLAAARLLSEQAIRIYGSYPNPDGVQATLDRFVSLQIDPQVVTEISREWAGPDVTTMTFEVTQVDFEPQVTTTATTLALDAIVSQRAVYANTPEQVYLPVVRTTLEYKGDRWTIIKLEMLGA